ncbi:hypothetical protein GQ53DRAFT_753507 [Thozetella sp. PMI_491]|nr:hypothetical protein GQ53DRAFT_753507 [Thozetella sp. PMI_491]
MGKSKNSKPAASKSKGGESTSAAPPPSWPVFKPPLPVSDLAAESLVPGKVVVFRTFWPRSLCREYISFLSRLPLSTTPGKPKRGDAVRVNDRYQIQDPQFANRLWTETGLKDALRDADLPEAWGGDVVGLSPNIRIYRYSKGQFFDCHYDESNHVTVIGETLESIPAKTTWTLLLYLTSAADGCMGGETVFYTNDRPVEKEAVPVAPETGLLLLHKHGDDCMLHEGREVTSGEKWVIRTDLCVRC